MLPLDIRRVAKIGAIAWKPTTDDDHLISVDGVGTTASMWISSGAVVSGERLNPCERWYGQDVGIIIGECPIETISTIEVTM